MGKRNPNDFAWLLATALGIVGAVGLTVVLTNPEWRVNLLGVDWVQAARDKDPRTRLQAVEALAWRSHDDKKAHPALVEATRDENAHIRLVATRALRGKEAIPALIERLGDENEFVVEAAASNLYEIGRPALSGLVQALQHNEARVRAGAAYALGFKPSGGKG